MKTLNKSYKLQATRRRFLHSLAIFGMVMVLATCQMMDNPGTSEPKATTYRDTTTDATQYMITQTELMGSAAEATGTLRVTTTADTSMDIAANLGRFAVVGTELMGFSITAAGAWTYNVPDTVRDALPANGMTTTHTVTLRWTPTNSANYARPATNHTLTFTLSNPANPTSPAKTPNLINIFGPSGTTATSGSTHASTITLTRENLGGTVESQGDWGAFDPDNGDPIPGTWRIASQATRLDNGDGVLNLGTDTQRTPTLAGFTIDAQTGVWSLSPSVNDLTPGGNDLFHIVDFTFTPTDTTAYSTIGTGFTGRGLIIKVEQPDAPTPQAEDLTIATMESTTAGDTTTIYELGLIAARSDTAQITHYRITAVSGLPAGAELVTGAIGSETALRPGNTNIAAATRLAIRIPDQSANFTATISYAVSYDGTDFSTGTGTLTSAHTAHDDATTIAVTQSATSITEAVDDAASNTITGTITLADPDTATDFSGWRLALSYRSSTDGGMNFNNWITPNVFASQTASLPTTYGNVRITAWTGTPGNAYTANYTYTLDDANATVNALAGGAMNLRDQFRFHAGPTAHTTSTLTADPVDAITIIGADDSRTTQVPVSMQLDASGTNADDGTATSGTNTGGFFNAFFEVKEMTSPDYTNFANATRVSSGNTFLDITLPAITIEVNDDGTDRAVAGTTLGVRVDQVNTLLVQVIDYGGGIFQVNYNISNPGNGIAAKSGRHYILGTITVDVTNPASPVGKFEANTVLQ